ncbi:hypothetical protein GQR36_20780 [Enterococcus termitis]
MEGSSLKEQSYNHLAFKIDESDYDEMLKKIKAYGLVIKEVGKESRLIQNLFIFTIMIITYLSFILAH